MAHLHSAPAAPPHSAHRFAHRLCRAALAALLIAGAASCRRSPYPGDASAEITPTFDETTEPAPATTADPAGTAASGRTSPASPSRAAGAPEAQGGATSLGEIRQQLRRSAATPGTAAHTPAATPAGASPATNAARLPFLTAPDVTIGGQLITAAEYNAGLREFASQQDLNTTSSLLRDAYHRELENQVLLATLARDVGADKDPEVQARERAARRSILAEYARTTLLAPLIEVKAAEVESYYAAHAAEFAPARRVRIRIIQMDSRATAEQVLRELNADRDRFAELAAKFSIHPTAQNGGTLEPFSIGTYSKAFAAVEQSAFSLPTGGLSDVIQTEAGYYFIIEKIGETNGRRISLEEARPTIEARLRAKRERETLDRLIGALRREAGLDTPTPTPK